MFSLDAVHWLHTVCAGMVLNLCNQYLYHYCTLLHAYKLLGGLITPNAPIRLCDCRSDISPVSDWFCIRPELECLIVYWYPAIMWAGPRTSGYWIDERMDEWINWRVSKWMKECYRVRQARNESGDGLGMDDVFDSPLGLIVSMYDCLRTTPG